MKLKKNSKKILHLFPELYISFSFLHVIPEMRINFSDKQLL